MKWGIVVLLIFGVVAAACAALLVTTMGSGSSAAAKGSQGIEVVVAKRSLPAMTVVTLDDFVKQKVSKNELPQGQQVASPARVTGRVLSVPVVEGQVLSESCFIADGTGAQVVAAIPEGMRAVTLNLNSRAVPDALFLYPGSVVDILFSFKLSSKSVGEAGSLTILSGVQVIAVNGESVVSNPEQETKAKTRPASSGLQVTVLVDQKQAEALQVLADNGNISLTIRNPLDKSVGDMQATVLSQGQLARLSSLLTAEGVAAPQKERAMRDWLAAQLLAPKDPNEQADGNDTSSAPMPAVQPQSSEKNQATKRPRWGVEVIRGRETKTEEFDVAGSQAGTDGEK